MMGEKPKSVLDGGIDGTAKKAKKIGEINLVRLGEKGDVKQVSTKRKRSHKRKRTLFYLVLVCFLFFCFVLFCCC